MKLLVVADKDRFANAVQLPAELDGIAGGQDHDGRQGGDQDWDAMASTELTFPPVAEENTQPATAIMGARMPMRSSMERKFCTLVMSEVLRVTRLAVPKRSISAEEKVCTLSNTRSRSWEANWVEMPEASRTEPRLIRQENTVMTAMMTRGLRSWSGTAPPPRC